MSKGLAGAGAPRRWRLRRWGIAAGLVALTLLLFATGLFPQQPLRWMAEGALRGATSPESRLGSLHLVPARLRADLADLVVRGPGYAIEIPRVRMVLSWRALVERSPAFRLLEIDEPRITLEPTAAEEAETGGPSPVVGLARLRIDQVIVRNGALSLRTEAGGALALSGLRAEGAIGSGSLVLTLQEGSWRGEPAVAFGPARARLQTAGLNVTVGESELTAGSTRLAVRGALLRAGAWQPDLTIEGRVDLTDAARRQALGPLSGVLALDGRVAGAGDEMRLSARLDGNAAWEEWAAESLRIEGSYDGASDAAEVALSGAALGGRIEGEARLRGSRTEGRVAARGIDPSRLPAGAAGVHGQTDLDLEWRGAIDGDLLVTARASGDLRRDVWSGRASITANGRVEPASRTSAWDWQADVRAEAPSLSQATLRLAAQGTASGPLSPAVSARLEGTASFAGAKGPVRMDLSSRVAASSEKATAQLEVRGDAGVARANATTTGDRLTALAVHGEALELGTFVPDVRGVVSFDLTGNGPLQRPSLSLEMTVDEAGWRETTLGTVRAGADGDTRAMAFRLEAPELGLQTTGELAAGATSRLHGHAQLRATPLGPLASSLSPESEPPVTGTLSADLDYDLDPERPDAAELTAEVSHVAVTREGTTFEAGPFRAALAAGQVTLRDLEVLGPGVRVAANGSAGLGADDAIDLLTRAELDLASLPAPEGWSLVGSSSADLTLRGSRERPAIEGGIRLQGVQARGESVPELRIEDAEARLDGDRLVLGGIDARVGGGTARLSGTVPFAALLPALRQGKPSDEAHLDLRWDGIRFEALDVPLAGALTVDGGLTSLGEVRARLDLPATPLRLEGQRFELLATTVQLAEGRLSAPNLTLRSTGGDFVVTGTADLVSRAMDLAGHGRLDLRALSPLLAEAAVAGTADVDVKLEGPFAAPRPRGTLRVQEGSLRLRMLPQALTAITGSVDFTSGGAQIEADGELGGGRMRLTGNVAMTETGIGDTRVTLTGTDVALRYPPGMRSRLDLDLAFTGRPGTYALGGDVVVQRGLYELDVALEDALRAAPVAAEESEILRGVGLDLRVRLARPVLVRSALGRLEATGAIAARGDLQEPLPFGRLDIRPGGRLEVQGREFTVTGGSLAYSGDWNARIALEAEATVRNDADADNPNVLTGVQDHRIQMQVQGTVEQLGRPTFTSEPSRSQSEIESLIATGSIDMSGLDVGAWLVGAQAGSLLADRFTQGVAGAFGLDRITIRPDLVANETDPSARFTFGKDLGSHLSVVYSAGLGSPETRFVQVEGRPGFGSVLTAQRTEAGAYTLGAGQRLRWGGARRRETAEERRLRIDEVRVVGTGIPDGLREEIRLRAGQSISEWKVQDEAERLREWLRERQYLEAEATIRVDNAVATVSVTAGPRYRWRVEGLGKPPDLGPILRTALFAEEALDEGRERLLQHLHARGHLRAEVTTAVEDSVGERSLVFRVAPGGLSFRAMARARCKTPWQGRAVPVAADVFGQGHQHLPKQSPQRLDLLGPDSALQPLGAVGQVLEDFLDGGPPSGSELPELPSSVDWAPSTPKKVCCPRALDQTTHVRGRNSQSTRQIALANAISRGCKTHPKNGHLRLAEPVPLGLLCQIPAEYAAADRNPLRQLHPTVGCLRIARVGRRYFRCRHAPLLGRQATPP